MLNHTAKILVWDIETSSIDILHRQYDLKVNTKYFNPNEIVRDWNILGVAWKWLGEPAKCISVSPKDVTNDYEVVRTVHEILESADILIGHNSKAFDLKKFNTRAIKHKLPPLSVKQEIDTLQVARSVGKFTSNKLSYLADYLGVDSKEESPDWNKILDGDADELRKMRYYNKRDVEVTEQVYFEVRGWIKNHPNLAAYTPIRDVEGALLNSCPNCNSTHVIRSGKSHTAIGWKQRFECRACRRWFLGRTTNKN